MKKILIILLVITTLLSTSCGFKKAEPQDTVKLFCQHYNEREFGKLVDLYDDDFIKIIMTFSNGLAGALGSIFGTPKIETDEDTAKAFAKYLPYIMDALTGENFSGTGGDSAFGEISASKITQKINGDKAKVDFILSAKSPYGNVSESTLFDLDYDKKDNLWKIDPGPQLISEIKNAITSASK